MHLKTLFPITVVISLVMSTAFNFYTNKLPPVDARSEARISNIDKSKYAHRLKSVTTGITFYNKKNGLNQRYCFLVDMSLTSGSNRFFVYDLTKDSIMHSGLVTHGSGGSEVAENIVFSNKAGSNCTSPGKYRIGKSYYGKFGLAFKLHGLEKTNSNAYARFVVLHAHPCVPGNEVSPLSICRSQGCPTVSPDFLVRLQQYIAGSHAPMLLWVFN